MIYVWVWGLGCRGLGPGVPGLGDRVYGLKFPNSGASGIAGLGCLGVLSVKAGQGFYRIFCDIS